MGITSMSSGSDPGAANYLYSHFLANPPNLNLYSAEKLVVDRADYAVSDLFLSQTGTYEASTGLNKITTDISTNWAAPLIGATGYAVAVATAATDGSNTLTVDLANCLNGTDGSTYTPQVGDIVSATGLPKGTYITALGTQCDTGSTAGTLTLSTDGSSAITSTTFSFYRHPQFQIYKFIP